MLSLHLFNSGESSKPESTSKLTLLTAHEIPTRTIRGFSKRIVFWLCEEVRCDYYRTLHVHGGYVYM